LGDVIRPTDWAAFGLIILAVVVMMLPRWIEAKPQQAANATTVQQTLRID
jgi:hypothetical protein